MSLYTYKIVGMHCAACVTKIKSALEQEFNIVSISLIPPQIDIESSTEASLAELNNKISAAGNYHLELLPDASANSSPSLSSYYPIILIALYITGVAFINNFRWPVFDIHNFMLQFMAGFFLVFSAFKLLNLRGFVDGYATYDLLAKRFYAYGYIYPFLELSLGILYLGGWFLKPTLIITILLMGFSSLGVINSLRKKQALRCACLGTLLNVPLTTITLIEDLTMVAMAAWMLLR